MSRLKGKIKPIAQIAIELLSIFFYIWVLERNAPDWLRAVFFWGICVGFPLYCIGSEQREFPEFNLGSDSFRACFPPLFYFTVTATVLLASMSLYFREFNYDGQFLARLSEYFFWAFLQQIGFQIFLTRRVQKIFRNPYLAAFVSASLFALIHFPNVILVSLSWVGGFFWALSYQKSPNLYLLAVSHGWLAVAALYCSPAHWLRRLRVGPSYWTF